jgi:hypothetical protein
MNDERLDQLIRDALHAEPAAEQVAQLEAFWQSRSRSERRWRTGRRALALAASVLAVAAVAGWIVRERIGQGELADIPRPKAELNLPMVAPPETAIVESPASPLGRAPTAMEQFAFYAGTQRGAAAADDTFADVVEDMIRQVAASEIEPQQALDATGTAMPGIERELLKRLPRSTEDNKRAVVRLLAVCGSEKSVPALLKLSRRSRFRDESLAAVEQIVGTAGLAEAARLAGDSQSRRMLMVQLLSADKEQTHSPVRDFLSLVQDAATRGDALAAAEAVPQLPLETLLTMLHSDEKPVRLSAALVLGHINGPEVTRHLVALVTAEQGAPTEAWIALLACRGELAEQFLSYASQRPQLLGQVNNARVEWARMNL